MLSLLDALFSHNSYTIFISSSFLLVCYTSLARRSELKFKCDDGGARSVVCLQICFYPTEAVCLLYTHTRLRPYLHATTFHAHQPYPRRAFVLNFCQYWPFDFNSVFVHLWKQNDVVCMCGGLLINQYIHFIFNFIACCCLGCQI